MASVGAPKDITPAGILDGDFILTGDEAIDGANKVTESSPNARLSNTLGSSGAQKGLTIARETVTKKFGAASADYGTSRDAGKGIAVADYVGPGTGDFCFEVWWKAPATSFESFFSIWADTSNGNDRWHWYYDAGSSLLKLGKFTGTWAWGISVSWHHTPDTWYHLAITRSSNSIRMFVDGTQVGGTDTGVFDLEDYAQAYFGRDFLDTDPAVGIFDELRISHVPRYTTNFAVPTEAYTPDTDTVVLLHFDENPFVDDSTVLEIEKDSDQQKFGLDSFKGLDDLGPGMNWADQDDWQLGSALTVEAWLRFEAIHSGGDTGDHNLIGQYVDASNHWLLVYMSQSYGGLTNDSVVFIVDGSLIISKDDLSWVVDTWYHVALTCVADTWRLYIDGTKVSQETDVAAISDLAAVLRLFHRDGGGSQFGFEGWMTQIRIDSEKALYTGESFTPAVIPVIAGAVALTGDSKVGSGAIEFDGRSYLSIDPDPSEDFVFTADFLMEFWCKTDDDGAVVTNWTSGSLGWEIVIEGGVAVFRASTNGSAIALTLTGSTNIADGAWHHVAVARVSQTVTLYIDGTSEDSDTYSDSTYDTGANPVVIGAEDSGTPVSFLTGIVDEIRIIDGGNGGVTENFVPSEAGYARCGVTQLYGPCPGDPSGETVLLLQGEEYPFIDTPSELPPNNPPVAVADSYETDEDVVLNVEAPGVLGNDSDEDDDPITAVLDVDVTDGELVLNANGSFAYTPDPDFYGEDSFTYHAYDGEDDSNIVQVTLTIVEVNQPPVAVADSYETDEGVPLNVVAPGVLGNDTDADGEPLTAVLDVDVSDGTLVLDADGSFTYDPDHNFFGEDSFTYHANDGIDDSNIVTVTITVVEVNNPPVAVADNYATNEDVPLNVAASGVLSNDTDADDDDPPLIAVLDTDVSDGSLTLNADGSFSYTPDPGFFGEDSFTYHANDGIDDSNIVTVTLTVNEVNQPPVAVADTYATDEDVALLVIIPGVLGNDTDADGEPLTAILDTDVSDGSLTLNADGSFSYIPDPGFFGEDSFTYHANDGIDDSNIVTVTITVNEANNPPIAVADNYTTDEDVPLNVAAPGVLDNDSDVDGGPITAVLDTDVSDGTLMLVADGSFSYTPDPGFFGEDSFTYHADDGIDDSNIVTVTITVNEVRPVRTYRKATPFIIEGGIRTMPCPIISDDIEN